MDGIRRPNALTAATLPTESSEMTNTEDKPLKANHLAESATATEKHQSADKNSNTSTSQKVATTHQTEHGGPKGLEPTRYGDWERNGRCTDF